MQISLFDGAKKFLIDKPIRLIEMFAGYGSQHFALEYLGLEFESWKVCEWAYKSIQAYKDAHFKDDNIDYSKHLTTEQVYKVLFDKGISANYNEPMTYEQIKRLGDKRARQIYNNICSICNLVNIQQAKGKDLDIVDIDKYLYIMTYSFPCQDLSIAGFGKGMAKGSGTRSGMLWEVERILDELKGENKNLPQVLIMENVPEVIGQNNIKSFADWLAKLESLGYKSKWQVLNASNYYLPQNRERCFMVSILGDYYYDFPKEMKLDKTINNLLENDVDEKYYLSDKSLIYAFDCNRVCDNTKRGDLGDRKVNPSVAKTISCRGAESQRADVTNFVVDDNLKEYTLGEIRDQINGSKNMKEELCDMLVESGLLKPGTIINHSYTNGLNGKNPNSRQTLEDYIESENGICNCLTTRPDVLGIAVENLTTKNKRLANMVNKGQIDPNKTQAIDMYNQIVHEDIMHTIKTNVDKSNMNAITHNLRIRKLTPKECFRLMGVKDNDYDRIAENQSNASLYHLAGDSICTTVLMAIFGQMVDGLDYESKIKDFYNM